MVLGTGWLNWPSVVLGARVLKVSPAVGREVDGAGEATVRSR
jgi:hypothetical protein